MEHDHYQWALQESPAHPTGLRRASVLVIRSGGEIRLNGSTRRVDRGDILIIPPGMEPLKGPAFDLWTLSAAVLILLATARIFLDLY